MGQPAAAHRQPGKRLDKRFRRLRVSSDCARGSVRSRAERIGPRLRRNGIDHIEDVGRCTYGESREFFSYRGSTHRGEPDYGRHVNAIAIASDS